MPGDDICPVMLPGENVPGGQPPRNRHPSAPKRKEKAIARWPKTLQRRLSPGNVLPPFRGPSVRLPTSPLPGERAGARGRCPARGEQSRRREHGTAGRARSAPPSALPLPPRPPPPASPLSPQYLGRLGGPRHACSRPTAVFSVRRAAPSPSGRQMQSPPGRPGTLPSSRAQDLSYPGMVAGPQTADGSLSQAAVRGAPRSPARTAPRGGAGEPVGPPVGWAAAARCCSGGWVGRVVWGPQREAESASPRRRSGQVGRVATPRGGWISRVTV